MQSIKLKRLNENAKIPVYQTEGSSGFDFHASEEVIIEPGETKTIGTGLAMEIPKGFELQVRPRSGLSVKTGLRVSNAPGTVDSDFRGEIRIILDNIGKLPYNVKIGDRIAQGVICPVENVTFYEKENLSTTLRGSGGFGHTGG